LTFCSVFFSAYAFFLAHCVGNASGTHEAIQLAERRPQILSHQRQPSLTVPTNPIEQQIRSSSVQQNIKIHSNEPSQQSSNSNLVKRPSDSLAVNNSDEQTRRRSSVSNELNTSERSGRKGFTGSTSTTIHSSSTTQINKTNTVSSNEKVVIIDTTAVRFFFSSYE